VLVLALAYSTPLLLGMAACLLLATLLARAPALLFAARQSGWLRSPAGALAVVRAASALLAPASLLLGAGALALRGAGRYDLTPANFTMDSFAFWFVLLAALVPVLELRWWSAIDARSDGERRAFEPAALALLAVQLAWLYPLARLYSLGPWNAGWSLAAVLFGAAAAGWHALAALAQPAAATRLAWLAGSLLALALGGIGLGTSAGLAAGCFALLVYALLVAAYELACSSSNSIVTSVSELTTPAAWLLTPAFPFGAPFVATWMLLGAGQAGGVPLFAGVAWFVALLHALAAAIWRSPAAGVARRPLWALAALSLAIGAAAPAVVTWLVQPLVDQLQGGLTPYGAVNIWPWVGLAASDAVNRPVATLPSIALALLMLVLGALVYAVVRLAGSGHAELSGSVKSPADVRERLSALLHDLGDDVPWLGLLLGARSRPERPRGDTD
jgi:hypothetical protein